MLTKARFTFEAKDTNDGKIHRLDDLYFAYKDYVQTCVDLLAKDKKTNLYPSERRTYFPASPALSSQIKKNAQAQAVGLMQTWAKCLYQRVLSKKITKDTTLDDQQKHELRCCGKYGIRTPGMVGKCLVSQAMIDLYVSWVWDETVCGRSPTVSTSFPMMMSQETCIFEPSRESTKFNWWLRISTLESRKRVDIPLCSTSYLRESLAKTVNVSKTVEGRWRFQFSEELPDPVFDGSKGKVGIDVGLNCLAATSDGRLYGTTFKPKFERLYGRVRSVRSNRQRQGFKEDSKRLARLEQRLSGLTKTATGTIANKLVKAFPDHTFVIEDLDLRGCRGQKRFAYRALQQSLVTKAATEVVNPAYTSQECPSCTSVSRNNRNGIKFVCKVCGRKSHADVIGAVNLLGRSEDKQIHSYDHPSVVKRVLGMRYLVKRDSILGHGRRFSSKGIYVASELAPSSRDLTVGGDWTRSRACIGPNKVVP
jgi:hypothetical protein